MMEDDPKDAILKGSFPSNSFARRVVKPTMKFAIKFKAKLVPDDFEENAWATALQPTISAIFLKQPILHDMEELYQVVFGLCNLNMECSLYQRIEKECETFISAALQSLVGQSDDLVVFLSLVLKRWQDFCDQMQKIRAIASYLDGTYVNKTPNLRSLWNMGLQLFRKHLSLASEVELKTVFGLLKMIESERLGEAVDTTLISRLLEMLTALGMYPFLEDEWVKYKQQLLAESCQRSDQSHCIEVALRNISLSAELPKVGPITLHGGCVEKH